VRPCWAHKNKRPGKIPGRSMFLQRLNSVETTATPQII
jgi:hypothetical protein